jgi:hypothetical protein
MGSGPTQRLNRNRSNSAMKADFDESLRRFRAAAPPRE